MRWLTVDKATGNIKGESSSSKATAPPPSDADNDYVEATDEQVEQYHALRREQRQQGRRRGPRWDGSTIALRPETRPRFKAEASSLELDADGVDAITITVSKMQGPNVDTTFSGTERWRSGHFFGRPVRLIFTNGVATWTFKTKEPGQHGARSGHEYRLIDPLTVEAWG
jgi:hypothetical protein